MEAGGGHCALSMAQATQVRGCVILLFLSFLEKVFLKRFKKKVSYEQRKMTPGKKVFLQGGVWIGQLLEEGSFIE